MFSKLKRRVGKKTDYKQRLGLLKSGKPRLVIRKSLNNIMMQFVEYRQNSDFVISSAMTKELSKFGWLGAANTPGAYLTGLLAGYKAAQKGVKEANLDMGLNISSKGNIIYAAVKGCIDAGINVSINEEIIPGNERLSGKHIEKYASMLRESDAENYNKRFSSYIKKGVNPAEISKHVEETAGKIRQKFAK